MKMNFHTTHQSTISFDEHEIRRKRNKLDIEDGIYMAQYLLVSVS